jgi:hypothetical protein
MASIHVIMQQKFSDADRDHKNSSDEIYHRWEIQPPRSRQGSHVTGTIMVARTIDAVRGKCVGIANTTCFLVCAHVGRVVFLFVDF